METNTTWFVKQRMEWIKETLRIFGFINREHLRKKFGISTPQAASDFTRFMTENPNKMIYDKSERRYVKARGKHR